MLKPSLRSLPLINNQSSLMQTLATWRKHIGKNLQRPPAPAIPWNFSVTNARGGNQLNWSTVPRSDGFEILRSDNGDFSGGPGSNLTLIAVRDALATKYFDPLGGPPTKKWYKIRATSGTHDAPHSISGNATGIVTHTSIDSNDTTTVPSIKRDTTTTQNSQKKSGGVTTRGGTGAGIGGMGGDGIGGGVGGGS